MHQLLYQMSFKDSFVCRSSDQTYKLILYSSSFSTLSFFFTQLILIYFTTNILYTNVSVKFFIHIYFQMKRCQSLLILIVTVWFRLVVVTNGQRVVEDMTGFLLPAWMAQTCFLFLGLQQIGAEYLMWMAGFLLTAWICCMRSIYVTGVVGNDIRSLVKHLITWEEWSYQRRCAAGRCMDFQSVWRLWCNWVCMLVQSGLVCSSIWEQVAKFMITMLENCWLLQ